MKRFEQLILETMNESWNGYGGTTHNIMNKVLGNKLGDAVHHQLFKDRHLSSSNKDSEEKMSDMHHEAIHGNMNKTKALKLATDTLNNPNAKDHHLAAAIKISAKYGNPDDLHYAINKALANKASSHNSLTAAVSLHSGAALNVNSILDHKDANSAYHITDMAEKATATGDLQTAHKIANRKFTGGLASHTNDDILNTVAGNNQENENRIVSSNPHASANTLHTIINGIHVSDKSSSSDRSNASHIKNNILSHQNVDSSHIDKIAKMSNHDLHHEIVSHPKTSTKTLEHIAKHSNYNSVREVAQMRLDATNNPRK